MSKIKVKRKPANSTQLTTNRPQDVKSVENLSELAKVLPGCSDITSALRWLCEEEAPKATERMKAVFAQPEPVK